MQKFGTIPGVYISEIENPAATITAPTLRKVGVIGRSISTLTKADIVVTRGTGTVDEIPDVAPEQITALHCVSDYMQANGTNLPQYVAGTDYTFNAGGAYGGYGENYGKIVWLEGKGPAEGATYYVTITYTKDNTNITPKTYDSYEAVKAAYGPEYYMDGDNKILNEVVVGAKLAFLNGADVVTCLEVLEAGESAVQNAIDLMCDTDVIAFVCVPATTSTLQQYLMSKVVIASSIENQKEKIAYICPAGESTEAIKTLTVDQIIAQSQSFKEERIAMVAGATVSIYAEDKEGVTSVFEVPSIYAACAMIGWHGNNNNSVALPLTRKSLAGIYDIKAYKRAEIEKLTRGGVTVMVNRGSDAIVINQSVTTNTTSYNTAEISVVLIKDEIKRRLRGPLDAQFIGTVVKKTTGTSIKTAIISLLDAMVDNIIIGYDSLTVVQNAVDTTQFDVSFNVTVCRPLNYINISFMVNL